MRLVRHLSDLPFDELRDGSVVTIGAYDGLHLGHEQLLARVKATAEERGLPSIVMSFEPTPKEFFSSSNPPARLMRFREKFEALADHGIDRPHAGKVVAPPGWTPGDHDDEQPGSTQALHRREGGRGDAAGRRQGVIEICEYAGNRHRGVALEGIQSVLPFALHRVSPH